MSSEKFVIFHRNGAVRRLRSANVSLMKINALT
jgi:hypothetical protein